MNPNVDFYFTKAKTWKAELERLRTIILGCHLVEELKWGVPCYMFKKNNIVLIHTFKEYCAILFFKGALLKDVRQVLIQQTDNVQAARQMRFTSVKQIADLKATIQAYIFEAVEAEEVGLKVELKKTDEFAMPEEFQKALDEHNDLKTAFQALTPGRQRGYLLYFAGAKQPKTRIQRIEKSMQDIFDGKGLNDK